MVQTTTGYILHLEMLPRIGVELIPSHHMGMSGFSLCFQLVLELFVVYHYTLMVQ